MNDPPSEQRPPTAVLNQGAAAAVLAALPGARAVGGVVRDILAGREVHDVDVAAPYPPEEVATRLRAARIKVFETGLAHGTLTAVQDHQPVEVTSLRRDLATDGRHAEVAWTTDWREDAARRDFTINAMSMAADGRLWDYFGGRADLAAGLVRFVGDPATRLREDYLRALRFFRFHARYGRGAPDAAAVAAIRDAVPGLARLSAERVWTELKRLLAAPDPADAVALMVETGVLGAVFGRDWATPGILRALVQIGAPADPLLRFEVLTCNAATLARRLKASNEEVARLNWDGIAQPPRDPQASDDELRRLLLACGKQRLLDWAWIRQARDHANVHGLQSFWPPTPPDPTHTPALYRRFRDRVAAMPMPVFPLQGRDALAIGLAAGPELGKLLAATRAWWLAEGCTPDREATLKKLRELAGLPPAC